LPRSTVVVSKSTNPEREAYSAFEGTELAKILTGLGIRRIVIGGLTTEYCIKSTVADARALGLDVLVLADAIRAIDANPGDGERAIADMIARGARIVHTGDFASTSAASATSSGDTRTG
ncbi:MAG TPA: isochorismatase family protein, partial [Polyangiaceae bacterium]|nr:isochorismatase family protein [Polyangiaceae bacterium]